MKTVLTIAGFDPSSGAGVTADLMVFAAHRLFGTACITSLTVQSTLGVEAAHAVSGGIVGPTLSCLRSDLPPAGIKIGMLATAENVAAVVGFLEDLRREETEGGLAHVPVVVDPVLLSTSGAILLEAAAWPLLRESLLPLVDWVTPNVAELDALLGERVGEGNDVPRACRVLQRPDARRYGATRLGVVATGGDREPPDDFLLLPSGEERWLRGERVHTTATHGTGCAFSSALLSRLVLGDADERAAAEAKQYVRTALQRAVPRGGGRGPMQPLWPLLG